MRLERLANSTSARLGVVYALLLVAAFTVAAVAAWFSTRRAAEEQIRERVQSEMSALQQEMRSEGPDAVLAYIEARSGSPGALEYRLFSADGRIVAGNLEITQPTLGWSFVDLPDSETLEEGEEDLLVLAQPMPGGGVAAVAGDLLHAERVRAAVLSSIFWVGGLALLLALAAGLIAARGALARMDALSQALSRAGAGDLSARAPERAGGDDIDEMSRSVNAMLSRIDLLVANVRRVSTDIAHDLRTPLTHVRQRLEAASAAPDRTAAEEAIAAAQDKIDEILRVFAAMLRLAEIEAGAARSRFANVDLSALVERVTDAYRGDIEARGQSLSVACAPAVAVDGDSDLISQALANLIENAMRYGGDGAQIAVRLREVPGGVRLEVEDNGPGVDAADVKRAFDPFVRLDPSRGSPGAGLGLSIVAAIARLHQARVDLEAADPGVRAVIAFSNARPH